MSREIKSTLYAVCGILGFFLMIIGTTKNIYVLIFLAVVLAAIGMQPFFRRKGGNMRYHVHVYKIESMVEIDLIADSDEVARKRALELSAHAEFHDPDTKKIAISFEQGGADNVQG